MSYESKVIIAQNYSSESKYHGIVAVLNLCCMGSDRGWKELFNKPFSGEIYIENENEPTTEDKYGDALKWATVREVYDWCIKHKTEEGKTYWRQELLESLLKTMLFELGERANNLKVVHFGY